ncbi:RNA polymerase sigma-70 factor [Ramlibacter albus]|uniref:RNA polymerase sigma-70 factor n=1 Tax=Ramlibacter albus TaxID=2079448 RepID=A0A923S5D2_9BURK|nr:RNA polymerase sigma-70 factor [Ramlibacter albus]MBC5765052.1 RNA polymerase sigma-70 factor [Ramlibacter albus]
MDPAHLFEASRRKLHGVAYRMLGSVHDAEEVVQDAWLRWSETDRTQVDSPEAWLVTTTSRLALDRLRAAKVRRENYPGLWLPEPLVDDSPPTPQELVERADDISVAFLMLLEQLAPEARAAFLMREVFDASYAEVAQVVGKSEAACRQLVHRAKEQLREGRPRQRVSRDVHHQLLARFAEAAMQGDMDSLKTLLDEDAELIGDGGGVVPSFGVPLHGGQRIAQLYFAGHRRFGAGLRMEVAVINGEWGLLRYIDGQLESAQSLEVGEDGRIVRIYVQRNPRKLPTNGA